MNERHGRSAKIERLCAEYAEVLIPAFRLRARQLGYAIGVHGSLAHDIDLIAVPWRDGAASPRDLADAVQSIAVAVTSLGTLGNVDGAANPGYFESGCPGAKPHGRLGWVFHLPGGPYVDLSVVSPAVAKGAANG